MIIELRGVQFSNKGSELMIESIIEKMQSEFPDAQFAIEATNWIPARDIRDKGLLVIRRPKPSTFQYIPSFVLRIFGFVKDNSINVILDASGFAFGDKWGYQKAANRAANHIKKWKSQGKKIIFMPQAFGTFSDNKLKECMKIIIQYADLIFARDELSFNHLKNLDLSNSKIFLFPDFTNLTDGIQPKNAKIYAQQIAIIPNIKMTEKNNLEHQAYTEFLKKIINLLRDRNQTPFFLIHENNSDIKIAEEINESLTNKLEIIIEKSPLHIKGIIGSSKAVITSRYHGLVSSLSQAVPCLATSWSHKYQTLLEEYSFPEGLCNTTDSINILEQKLDIILNKPQRQILIEKLTHTSEEQKSQTRQMWSMVFKKIRE